MIEQLRDELRALCVKYDVLEFFDLVDKRPRTEDLGAV